MSNLAPNALLIAGTDTDAGKTVLTSALAAYWQRYCLDRLGIFKPIQTGVGDREHYQHVFGCDPDQVNPVHFQMPVAPPLAADAEGRQIELETVWQAFEQMRQTHDWVLVEGLGGLGSPINHTTTVADLAWDWRLPTLLVVPVRLGAIGQAVANVALARQSRVHLKGIILNCVQPCDDREIEYLASRELIESLTHVPVLGLMPYLSEVTNLDRLIQLAAALDLERILPFCPSPSTPVS